MSNLPVLPEVTYIDTDPSQIISDIINGFKQVTGMEFGKSDPKHIFLMGIGYRFVMERLRLEQRHSQQLLYTATGAALDHLGAYHGTERLGKTGAKTTVRFEISAPQPTTITIVAGTRVTSNNIIYFATTQNLEIPAGQTVGQVEVEALTTGAAGNGIDAGMINIIVDPFPFQQSVENITRTQGGADAESDDEYRERIYWAPTTFATTGAIDAYKTLAKAVSTEIIDISATTPSPCVAEIRPLMAGGELPTQTILDAIEAALTPIDKRPLTDYVRVLAPTVVNYNLDITYYIDRSNQANSVAIQSAINAAVDEFILWQKSKLDRDVNPTELHRRLAVAGAKRVEVRAPLFIPVNDGKVAFNSNKTVIYGGLEDE